MRTEQREQTTRYLPLTAERSELFVREWEGYVLSCLRRMRIAEEEDVLFRVFYRALKALPEFRSASKISTWLYRITWREGVRYIKKQTLAVQKESSIEEGGDPSDPGESALDVLERRETAERVQWALSRLPVKDREILALKYLEELKTDEIVKRLDIPAGTAKARIHRALARLKTLLEKNHDAYVDR